MATIEPLTRRSIALFLGQVRTRYPVVEAWLYGSRATGGSHEDSDIDLALVLDGTDLRPASSIAAEMGEATFDVLGETGQYVSPLPIRLDVWRNPARHSNPFLLANIRRDGIAL